MTFEINEDELTKYKKLSEKLKIKNEIKYIKLDIEKFEVREEIEEINLTEEKNELVTRLEILNEEANFSKMNNQFEILTKKSEIVNIKKRIIKLKGKKDSISQKVFDKLLQEYNENLDDNVSYLQKETDVIFKLKEKALEYINSFEKIKEELDIRLNLQDINNENYNNQNEILNSNKKRADSVLTITTLLLEELIVTE